MTLSLSAPDAPVRRSRRSSPEPGRPSCSWTRTDYRAIRSCPRIPSILRAWTCSTRWVSATPSARWHRPIHIVRLRKNDAVVDYGFAGGRAEYCPRRKRLDGLLQDAAASAGVEVLGPNPGDFTRARRRPCGRSASRRTGGSGARLPGGSRRGSRRPSFHRRTRRSRRRNTSPTMPRERCSGDIGMLPRSGGPIRPIDSGCTSRIPMATFA